MTFLQLKKIFKEKLQGKYVLFGNPDDPTSTNTYWMRMNGIEGVNVIGGHEKDDTIVTRKLEMVMLKIQSKSFTVYDDEISVRKAAEKNQEKKAFEADTAEVIYDGTDVQESPIAPALDEIENHQRGEEPDMQFDDQEINFEDFVIEKKENQDQPVKNDVQGTVHQEITVDDIFERFESNEDFKKDTETDNEEGRAQQEKDQGQKEENIQKQEEARERQVEQAEKEKSQRKIQKATQKEMKKNEIEKHRIQQEEKEMQARQQREEIQKIEDQKRLENGEGSEDRNVDDVQDIFTPDRGYAMIRPINRSEPSLGVQSHTKVQNVPTPQNIPVVPVSKLEENLHVEDEAVVAEMSILEAIELFWKDPYHTKSTDIKDFIIDVEKFSEQYFSYFSDEKMRIMYGWQALRESASESFQVTLIFSECESQFGPEALNQYIHSLPSQ